MRTPSKRKSRSSGDRLLTALALFTVEQPQWTVEAAADQLGVSARPRTAISSGSPGPA